MTSGRGVVRQPKIEENTNRTRKPEPKQKANANADYAKASSHGDQKGTFVGAPAGIHIHVVGNNTHIIIRGDRTELRLKAGAALRKKSLTDAKAELVKKGGGASVKGYTNCLNWLNAELKK